MNRPARVAPVVRAAGFWRRYAAWSLDAAIVGIPVVALTWSRSWPALHEVAAAFDALATRLAASMMDGMDSTQEPLSLALALANDATLHAASAALQSALWGAVQPGLTGFVIAAAAYWIVFERSSWQATPGKRALGLMVTDTARQRIGLGRALARHVAGALSWLTLNLGHALAALPPNKRALHDHIAGTRVLQNDASAPLPAWARAWLALQALLAIASTAWLLQAASGALRFAIDSAL